MRPFYYLIFCGVLTACATPPELRPQPKSAAELAALQLPGNSEAEKPIPIIASLPQPPTAAPPTEIRNSGSLPPIRSYQQAEVAAPSVPAGQDVVTLNLEQVPLREVLQMVADTLKLTVVIDPSIGDKVTIRTAPEKPLRYDDLWPLLQLLLKENDISMEKRGEVYYLKKEPNTLPLEIGQASARLAQSDASQVLQITPLRYIALESALTTLRPLVEPEGRLMTLPALNVVGIISTPAKLQRINTLLGLVDADPFVHRGIRLFRLNHVKAAEAKAEIDKILQAVEGQMPSYAIIDLERVNALLVVAPPKRGFTEVERWISILDEENEAGGEQVFIYQVRNLKATELASTLMEVFKPKDDKDTPTPKPNAEQATPTDKPAETQKLEEVIPKPLFNQGNQNTPTVSAELQVNIVSDEATNSLLVRATPKDYRQLLDTIALLDRVPKEVMINVVIAEVELTDQHQFGIDWSKLFGSGNRGFIGSDFKLPAAASVSTDGIISRSNNGLVLGYVGDKISAVLNILSTNGHVELLSRPSLLVRNNQEASINVGSDEPTITRVNQTNTGLNTGLTTSNEVQYRKTGIILKVKPQINEDGVINMEVRQEVSAIGALRTGDQLPSFRERVIETSLVVKDGNAIAMGGLIQTNWNTNYEGLPGLQELPVAGRLFQSEDVQKVRTELVVIIVPQIIHPEADNSDYVRQFRDRMLEVKRLMENDDTPVVFNPSPKTAQITDSTQLQPGDETTP